MEFNNNVVRKVIKHVSTRWLSLGKCLERTLKQWDSLESCFLSNFDLEDDPEDQTDETGNREKRLVNAFKNTITKLYAMFFQSVIPIFDSFNTFLQSEEPLIHVLHQSAIRLYRSLLTRFIHAEVISSSEDVLSIDLDNPDFAKGDNEISIGAMTKQYARDNDIIGTSQYKKFLKECKKFYMTCAKYLQKSMPVLHDEVIKSLTFLRLPERHQASTDDLEVIINRFPNVINSDDLNDLEAEFLDYQAAPNTELPAYFDEDDKPIRIDQVWHKVSLLNDAFSGLPRFKHLAKLAKVLLLIPHSNAYCESVFSTIRKICTTGRHNLGKDAAKGHASTSVYKDTTSIRNNLLGILITKINIFGRRKIQCYEWEPPKQVISHAKSVTYTNLKARRDAANE